MEKELYDSISKKGREGILLDWLFEHENNESLPEYSEITGLDLYGNNTFFDFNNELPKSITKLSNLESLEVVGCGLKKLPDNIGELKELKYIDITGNMIDELPDSLGQCIGLEILDISRNEINSLPENIGDLQNLQELYMQYCNELKTLPESFGQLKQLKKLNLYGTVLEKLPESFNQLANLEELIIQFNTSEVGEKLVELPNLKVIHLTSWQLKDYPYIAEKLKAKGIEIIYNID